MIELAIPGSAVRLASVARHVTDCATRPGIYGTQKQTKSDRTFDFIWDSKPDKIKRSVIMQDYKHGGLRLTNIDYFIEALKAVW